MEDPVTRTILHSITFTSLCCLLLSVPLHADDVKTTAAIMAAENYLIMIDTGQYGQSWDISSSFFKSQVPKETWVRQISTVRPQFGNIVKRTIKSAQYVTQLPGAPDGEYVVIQYDSSYEKKKNGLETVTPMLDKDGTWRVSGYYIK